MYGFLGNTDIAFPRFGMGLLHFPDGTIISHFSLPALCLDDLGRTVDRK